MLEAYRCINDKTFDPVCLIFAGLLQVVDNCFSDLGVKEWKKSTIGFGVDGASVNLGKRRGVASLLKREVDHLIDIHCLPHRLELSMMEMQQECKYVKEVYDILHLVWKTYHFSPKSKRELKALGNELGLDVLKPRPVRGSGWLPHASGALRVFIKPVKDGSIRSDPAQYAAVLAHMEHVLQHQLMQMSKEEPSSLQKLRRKHLL